MFRSRLWITGLCALACSGRSHAPAPVPSEPCATALTEQIDTVARVVEPTAGPLPPETRQLVLGITASWDATPIELSRFERDVGGSWRRVGAPWPATIGLAGLAWGDGLHGTGAPGDRAGSAKREGDGKSPAGAFEISRAFGYAPAPVDGARLPYTRATRAWRCVDDAASAHYARVLDETTVAPDWSSAEYMRRRDALYEWVIAIEHNPNGVPSHGSCIFFHVWDARRGASIGCTAMARDSIERLLAWLDPGSRPVVVQLPHAEYAALREPWGLPGR